MVFRILVRCYIVILYISATDGNFLTIGNTCFMNSALQCLSSTEPLRDVFLKEEYHTYINVVIYTFHYKLFLHSQQH